MEKDIDPKIVQKALMLLEKELSDVENSEGEAFRKEYLANRTPELEERIKDHAFSTLMSLLIPEPQAVVKLLMKHGFLQKEDKTKATKWLTSFRSHNTLATFKEQMVNLEWEEV